MKNLLFIFLFLSWHCFADECTHQLDGYIKKLEAITDSAYLTDAHKQQAQNELRAITQLRSQSSDCAIASQIPALAKSREAMSTETKTTEPKNKQQKPE